VNKRVIVQKPRDKDQNFKKGKVVKYLPVSKTFKVLFDDHDLVKVDLRL